MVSSELFDSLYNYRFFQEGEAEDRGSSSGLSLPLCPQVYVTCVKEQPSSGNRDSPFSDSRFETSQEQVDKQATKKPFRPSLPLGEQRGPGVHVPSSPYNKSCLARPTSSPIISSRSETPTARSDPNSPEMNLQRLTSTKSPPDPPPRKYLVTPESKVSPQQQQQQQQGRKARFFSSDHRPTLLHQPQACNDYVSHTIIPPNSSDDACASNSLQPSHCGTYEQIESEIDRADIEAAVMAVRRMRSPQTVSSCDPQMRYVKAAADALQNRGEFPLQFSLSDPGRSDKSERRSSAQQEDSKSCGSPKGTRGRVDRNTLTQSSESSTLDVSIGKSSPLYTSKVPKPVVQKRTQI